MSDYDVNDFFSLYDFLEMVKYLLVFSVFQLAGLFFEECSVVYLAK